VCVSQDPPVKAVLQPSTGVNREPAADEVDRSISHRGSGSRNSANDDISPRGHRDADRPKTGPTTTYENPRLLAKGVTEYIFRNNSRRPHESLSDATPDEKYYEQQRITA